MKRTSSIASLALALAAGAMMGGVVPISARASDSAAASAPMAATAKGMPRVATGSAVEKAAWLRMRGSNPWAPFYPRAGWSVRHGQRMARKRRNQARHRRACRG